MKLFVIADPDTTLAFELAGISGQAVRSPSEVPAVLEGLDRAGVGLVLITEALAEPNRPLIEKLLLEPGGVLILEIPDAGGERRTRPRSTDRILSLLRR